MSTILGFIVGLVMGVSLGGALVLFRFERKVRR